jgi:hypothetical protein
VASVEIRTDLTAAESLARRMEGAAERLPGEAADAIQGLGDDAELIFAAHALRRSGRMARNITAEGAGLRVAVTVHARNPETGYDYVGVTRFGHRVARIYPKRAKALRTPWGPRASVAGFHPATDWRDDALPAVHAALQATETRLGRRIEALL